MERLEDFEVMSDQYGADETGCIELQSHFVNNLLIYILSASFKSSFIIITIITTIIIIITITHIQEHKTTVTAASGSRYTVIDRVKFTAKEYR
jgi:hypothetical protein